MMEYNNKQQIITNKLTLDSTYRKNTGKKKKRFHKKKVPMHACIDLYYFTDLSFVKY